MSILDIITYKISPFDKYFSEKQRRTLILVTIPANILILYFFSVIDGCNFNFDIDCPRRCSFYAYFPMSYLVFYLILIAFFWVMEQDINLPFKSWFLPLLKKILLLTFVSQFLMILLLMFFNC